MLNPPQSLNDLVAYLTKHPRVRCTAPNFLSGERRFIELDQQGRLWWEWEDGQRSFTPTRCSMTVDFYPDGFTVQTFGRLTRFDYLAD